MIALCKKTIDEIALLLSSKVDFPNIRSAVFILKNRYSSYNDAISPIATFQNMYTDLEVFISTSNSGIIQENIRFPLQYLVSNSGDDELYPLDKIFPKNLISLSSVRSWMVSRRDQKLPWVMANQTSPEDMRSDFINIDLIESIENCAKKENILITLKPIKHSTYAYSRFVEISKDYIGGLYRILENRGRYDLLI